MRYRQIIITVLAAACAAWAQIPIAVLDFEANGISNSENKVLSNRLRNEMVRLGTYQVIERDMIEDILQEQGFQQSGCTTNECLVTIGRLVGVRQIVAGSIGTVGKYVTVSARVIDVETGEVLEVTDYDLKGDVGRLLTKGMKRVAGQLSGREETAVAVEEKGNFVTRFWSSLSIPKPSLPSLRPLLPRSTVDPLWHLRFGMNPFRSGTTGYVSYRITDSVSVWELFRFSPWVGAGYYSYFANQSDVSKHERGLFASLGGEKVWTLKFATVSASAGIGVTWYDGYWNWYDGYGWSGNGFSPTVVGTVGFLADRFILPAIFEISLLYLPYSEDWAPYITVGYRL